MNRPVPPPVFRQEVGDIGDLIALLQHIRSRHGRKVRAWLDPKICGVLCVLTGFEVQGAKDAVCAPDQPPLLLLDDAKGSLCAPSSFRDAKADDPKLQEWVLSAIVGRAFKLRH
ncbi:MAG: hypothetical protein COV34_01820 [Candidatus Zambryskibacteria bacterium CG10_big_fil_rev_8_21_14_0_10_42_12]|uniref:Uncharacterized protein n=1 Tax=Candidatus Zambryskibacteria bacterium CG10_big_fil_rev_8_21_14_0_10_42_12 TaxID=1975115 RepID=A0A2H0QWX7_9BACT|nr:MAG: hypothetical protein COV34_01820 [Candidatus Zambryskibacteria bacterium CG10_big_fil_rev_8_21_14_0_10_42_12]